MRLKRIAEKWCQERPEAWDEAAEAFVPASFKCRIDLTDRFLSNFNRPTRMRMLFAAAETVFPDSRTIRNPLTGDVYILGTTRKDVDAGRVTIGLTLLRTVTALPGGSAGYAVITRKVTLGPPENPGWLVDTVYKKAWMDTEFYSSSNEQDTTDLRIESYNAFMPLHVQPREWDFVELRGSKYRVVDTYADSGFFGVRLEHESDTRTDMVLEVQPKREINRITQEYIQAPAARYNVTGVMKNLEDFALWNNEAQKYIDVYFEEEHLPNIDFNLSNSPMWLSYKGKKRMVKQASTQSGVRQWQLRCE